MDPSELPENEYEAFKDLPESTWYKYVLLCGHVKLSKTRIRYPKPWMIHFIRCKRNHQPELPTQWVRIKEAVAIDDSEVPNVSDGAEYVLPKWIMRTDGYDKKGRTVWSGLPYPYSTAGTKAEY